MTGEQKTKAKIMHEEGMGYRAIGAFFGVGGDTVARNIDPVRRDKYAVYQAKYRTTHKTERAAYRAANKEEIAAHQAAHDAVYYVAHKDEIAAYQAAYYLAHKDEYLAHGVAYYLTHKEEKAAYGAAYYLTHKDEYIARANARRALIAKVTVGNIAEIAEIYRQAREDEPIRCYLCSDLIPIGEREVDHVIPIIPNDPSIEPGKHATSNLRIVHMRCNRRKNNKMLCELDWIIGS